MRRSLPRIVTVLALLAPATSRAVLLGDVNLDGKVDSADYTLLNQFLGGTATLTWDQRDAADVAPLGSNDLVGDGIVDSADALVFDSALQGNDLDGDGLNVSAETGGTTATNGSPFLRDTDRDGSPDDVDPARGSFSANQAPGAPTIAITSTTTTTLGGTVSACSNPDGLPYPSTCTQEIRVVAAGGTCESATVTGPVTPSGGSWTATGLTSGVVYTVYARSSDGALAACSAAATRSTTPTANAPVAPYLDALPVTTTSNPVTLTGIAAPGQEIRVRVNGAAQDYLRSFVAGNPEYPSSPFVAAASTGAFSVPVVLDDAFNVVQVTAIGAGGAESGWSNLVVTNYQNNIVRSPLGLPVVNEGGINRYVVNPGATGEIIVFTKGIAPAITGEYVAGSNYLEVKPNGLLVIQPGAIVKFNTVSGTTPQRRLIVGGSLQIRGTAASRPKVYSAAGSYGPNFTWLGIEFQSSSRVNFIGNALLEEAKAPVNVIGTPTSRPDLTITNSDLTTSWDAGTLPYTGVAASFGGALVVRNNWIDVSGGYCRPGPRIVISDSTSIDITGNRTDRTDAGILVVRTPATIEFNVAQSVPGTAGSCDMNDQATSRGIAVIGDPTDPSVCSASTRIANNFVGDRWEITSSDTGFALGIHVEDCSATVEGNFIRECDNGIRVLKTSATSVTPLIRDNRIVYLQGSSTSPTGAQTGIQVDGQAGATITENFIANENSGIEYGRGIRVTGAGSTAIEISENKMFHLSFGIQIMNGASVPVGENIVIRDNSIDQIRDTGIYLERSNARIEGNTILDLQRLSGTISYIGAIYLLDSASEVTENYIRGSFFGVRADGGTPEITKNDILGIATSTTAGVKLSGTLSGTTVQGNRIQGYTSACGIHVSNLAIALINQGNVITGNGYGVYVLGAGGSPSDSQPVASVNGNSIYNNKLTTGPLRNFQTASYRTVSASTLDLTGNWWGVVNPSTAAAAGIVIGTEGSGGFLPTPDFSGALSGPLASGPFISKMSAKIGSVDSRMAFFVPNLAGNPVPVATVSFTVHDSAASIVLRICPETAATCNAASAVYSSAPQSFAVGTASITWNGADSAGKVVAAEAYAFVLEATRDSVTQVLDLPGVATGADWLGSETTSGGTIVSTTYDTFQNSAFQIEVIMDTADRPGRIWFEVLPLDSLGRPQQAERFLVAPVGYPAGAPVPSAASGTFTRTFTWNGRNPAGEVIAGQSQVVARTIAMRDNVIIVDASSPIITGVTGTVNVTVDPYLVYDVFEQIASFTFKVDRISDVTIALLPPDSWSDLGAPTWVFSDVPANSPTPVVFRGHKAVGMQGVSVDEAKELLATLAQEGAFTFRIRAEDDVSRRITDSYVTLQMRH